MPTVTVAASAIPPCARVARTFTTSSGTTPQSITKKCLVLESCQICTVLLLPLRNKICLPLALAIRI
jgi:hypothetical protein